MPAGQRDQAMASPGLRARPLSVSKKPDRSSGRSEKYSAHGGSIRKSHAPRPSGSAAKRTNREMRLAKNDVGKYRGGRDGIGIVTGSDA